MGLFGDTMNLFGDTVDMKWDKDHDGNYHGHGYGMGEKYIFVGEYIHGTIWGDLLLFDNVTGQRILKAEMEDSMAHGRYEYYQNGTLCEKGMYRNGKKYFHVRFRGGKIYEYGFSKDDKLNGYGCTKDKYGQTYTSPNWDMGVINGLGCIQDTDKAVIFYGIFKNNLPLYECNEKHAMMLKLWAEREVDHISVQCAESVLS